MSQVTNTHPRLITNARSQFVRGLRLRAPVGHIFDFDVSVSNQRIPARWSDLSFATYDLEDAIHVVFKKPCNYFHYRVELCSQAPQDIEVDLILEPSMSHEEALALMKTQTLVLAGCARNCIGGLDESIELARQISSHFKASKILVFENDSTDGTAERLAQLASEGSVDLMQSSHLDAALPHRTQRLGYGRNRLLRRAAAYSPDLYCVLDMDGIVGRNFSMAGFVSNFEYFPCWDAVFPANKTFYYDIWAFRHEDLCPGDYERRLNELNPVMGTDMIFDSALNFLQKLDFTRLEGWLPVSSAFGGMGLYKFAEMHNTNYYGSKDGFEACEHVPLHLKLERQGAGLYINPRFLVDSHILHGG